ncbi:MAG: hypothetical protein C0506_15770 [Anaerolinea sp.]|nr:hypothetical protein [Anaerolinea sp.]
MSRKTLVGAFAALILGLTSLGVGSKTASAEVVFNDRIDAVRSLDNPCEPGTYPIPLSGVFHHVWYTTPEGTLKMNIQGHLTGTDADGTEYVVITQQHMEHWEPFPPANPMGRFTDTRRISLISKGSTVNALLVMTFDVPAGAPQVPTTTATACVG